MNAKYVVAAVVVLLAVGIGAAAFVGVGPMGPDDGESAVTDTPESTGTVYESGGSDGGGDGSGSGSGTDTASQPPYAFEVVKIEECGDTCRDVTVELVNNRDETATNVKVYTRIFAGNSTDSDDKVWEGTEDVGSLEAGASTTSTKRVELSYGEAIKIKNNDGWITILTTVESDDVTITFKERRNVT